MGHETHSSFGVSFGDFRCARASDRSWEIILPIVRPSFFCNSLISLRIGSSIFIVVRAVMIAYIASDVKGMMKGKKSKEKMRSNGQIVEW